MSFKDILREKNELLVESYESNVQSARSLQQTLQQDILPGLMDELNLDDEGRQMAQRWLNDLQSIFRLLRRQNFTVSFTLESVRDVLLWRLAVVPPEIPCPTTRFLYCLPPTAQDPFGRPIAVVSLVRLLESSEDVRTALIHYMELLRLNLEAVNNERSSDAGDNPPILQYVALVDIGGLSMQSVQNADLVTWFIYELVPRFPGMLAAVFILNYSWAHSGVWNIVKRVLPRSALSRVFFPSREELLEYFSPAAVPHDYGGSLPSLSQLEDPLENYMVTLNDHREPTGKEGSEEDSADRSSLSSQPIPRVPSSISPYSHLNPYFGYPVSGRGAPIPKLRHGRQRKRDLLRTLAALWWSKWKHRVLFLLCVVLAVVSFRLRRSSRALKGRQYLRGLLHLSAARS